MSLHKVFLDIRILYPCQALSVKDRLIPKIGGRRPPVIPPPLPPERRHPQGLCDGIPPPYAAPCPLSLSRCTAPERETAEEIGGLVQSRWTRALRAGPFPAAVIPGCWIGGRGAFPCANEWLYRLRVPCQGDCRLDPHPLAIDFRLQTSYARKVNPAFRLNSVIDVNRNHSGVQGMVPWAPKERMPEIELVW